LNRRTLATLALTAACVAGLPACVPLIATGVGTGVASTLDRRTYGVQLMDQEIEIRVMRGINARFDNQVDISTTAYNGWVVLSGQASSEAFRAEAEKIALDTPNVRKVFNEVTVGWPASFATGANDRLITSKIKTRLFDPELSGISGHHVKIVTEAGSVFMLGMLTEAESRVAIEIARTTTGVQKVVNLFEIISEEEARRLTQPPASSPSSPR
jgi:osmotically-inducible protein OsmY